MLLLFVQAQQAQRETPNLAVTCNPKQHTRDHWVPESVGKRAESTEPDNFTN